MVNIKLIALDIDGTLATSKYTISPKTMDAMQKCHDQGIEVVLCSGRSLPEMQPFLQHFSYIRYVIVGNGTRVYDLETQKRLYANTFDSNIIIDLARKLTTIPNLFEYYLDEKAYIETEELGRLENYGLEDYRDFLIETRTTVDNIVDDLEKNPKQIEKVNFHFKTAKEQQKAMRIAMQYDCSVTTSFRNNIEITANESNKATGLHFLANYLNITPNEIMAVGDNINDIEMIEFAGIGVAMGNAVLPLKKIANFVTTSNDEDGIAVAIEKYIFND